MRAVFGLLGLVAGCGFELLAPAPVAEDGPHVIACDRASPAWWDRAWTRRYRVDAGGAPAGYTLRIPAADAIALATTNDLRVVVHDGGTAVEIDRVIEASSVVVRVPASGTLWIYTGNSAAAAPMADPSAVYLFAESFDSLPVGSAATPQLAPVVAGSWGVVADGVDPADHHYRPTVLSRNTAQITGLMMLEGEIEARLRPGPVAVNNHNGLAVRATTLVQLTLDTFVGQLLEDDDVARVCEYRDGVSPPMPFDVLPRLVERGRWYHMRVRFAASVVELFVDGVLESTGPNPNADGQLLGLFAHFSDGEFDDVRVRRVITPEPSALVGGAEICGE